MRSWRDVGGVIVRYAPLIGVVTVLAVLGMALLAKSTERSGEAKARVVLTREVVWPYYDAVRDQQVEIIGMDTTFAEVARRIADVGQLTSLSVSVPTGQAFVDVVAVASSNDAAVAAANAAADYLVELNEDRIFGDLVRTRDEALAELASIEATIEQITQALTDIEPRIAALQVAIAVQVPSVDDIAQVRLLENERISLLERRSTENSRRNNAIFTADAAQTELRNTEGQVAVLRRAFGGATDPGRTKGLILLAGVAAAFVATLGAIGYDAAHQRIRSRRHAAVGAARDLPIVAADEVRDDTAWANRILEARLPGEVVGVAAATASNTVSTRATSSLAAVLARSHTRVMTLGEGYTSPSYAGRLVLTDILSSPREGGARAVAEMRHMLERTDHVHVEVDAYLKAGGVIEGAEGLRAFLRAASELVDVIVVDCGSAMDGSSRWRAFAGVCDVIVLMVEPKRTRQSALKRAIGIVAERPVRCTVVSLGLPHVVTQKALHAEAR